MDVIFLVSIISSEETCPDLEPSEPRRHYLHTESTPLHNPFWQYAKDKILSEDIFNRAYREQSFPVTIVRPWHTYGQTRVPTATMGGGYTSVHRVRNGLPVVVQGDGQSLWGLTWSGDLAAGIVGLFGQEKALGEAFHICTEEILTWDQIYRIMAKAAGASSVELVHLPSEIIHSHYPDIGTPLIGDLSYSAVYDLSKIRRIIPDYRAKVTWTEGVSRSIAWFDDDPKRREVDEALNKKIDNLVEVARKARG